MCTVKALEQMQHGLSFVSMSISEYGMAKQINLGHILTNAHSSTLLLLNRSQWDQNREMHGQAANRDMIATS